MGEVLVDALSGQPLASTALLPIEFFSRDSTGAAPWKAFPRRDVAAKTRLLACARSMDMRMHDTAGLREDARQSREKLKRTETPAIRRFSSSRGYIMRHFRT